MRNPSARRMSTRILSRDCPSGTSKRAVHVGNPEAAVCLVERNAADIGESEIMPAFSRFGIFDASRVKRHEVFGEKKQPSGVGSADLLMQALLQGISLFAKTLVIPGGVEADH